MATTPATPLTTLQTSVTSQAPVPLTTPTLAHIPSLHTSSRDKRSLTTVPPTSHTSSLPMYFQVYDGQLDTNSNYTGFVEVIGMNEM